MLVTNESGIQEIKKNLKMDLWEILWKNFTL
ncbi:MAG: hypothetical protein Ct9H90mP17_2600 [Actinomycetota bacterium]|nr:MAG: hypothetical protein Ct9H90mP17_2600 [Actinomycetota bacterium]